MLADSPVLKRWAVRVLVAITILAVGSIVGVLAITTRTAEIGSPAIAAADETALRRSIYAYAARYAGMASHCGSASENLRRGIDAYAARYTGMAQHYIGADAALRRAISAYGARYTGMAKHFTNTSDGLQRGMAAYAARYAAMSHHYATQSTSSQRRMDAYAARCNCMAEYHLGEGKQAFTSPVVRLRTLQAACRGHIHGRRNTHRFVATIRGTGLGRYRQV